jgi:hypothetical protein
VRTETDILKLEAFMTALAARTKGPGRIYLTGGATALLHRWRLNTLDIDLKAAPEPQGFFEAIAILKDQLDVNVELAAPDQFIPPLPGWQERSVFIARHGTLDFHHYDYYSQALAKLERGHTRDLLDVRAMLDRHMITLPRLQEFFAAIEPELIRYPAITPSVFREQVENFCSTFRP